MGRRVFFSFHFERDVWRACQVRNSWVTKDREAAGFWDAAEWEEVQRKGDEAIKAWIDEQMFGTSVTVVLVGAETASRAYVGYEITQSVLKRNGIVAVRVHQLKDQAGRRDCVGPNPLDMWTIPVNGRKCLLSRIYPTYDWLFDDGYEKFGSWVEQAAQVAGR